MKPELPILTLVVALSCEAKPWIDFYKLKKVVEKPFSLFARQGVNVEVVITGIGAIAMSTAVGWIAGYQGSAERNWLNRIWLNIGIAGHADRAVGEIVRVHSYIDAGDLGREYSPQTAKWAGDSDALMSVNAPTTDYPDQAMVDMEGGAFYSAAKFFSSSELVESIKVISDNENNNVESLNASKISQLMAPHVLEVDQFLDNLSSLSSGEIVSPLTLTLNDLRATHSQRQQLKRLLHRASVLQLHKSVEQIDLSTCFTVSDILSRLQLLIDDSAPVITADTVIDSRMNNG